MELFLKSIEEIIMSKKSLVYIIQNQNLNITKIGITSNIHKRKRQLECQSGCLLNLYYTTELLLHAKIIEKSLHTYFKKYRLEGEYFNLSAEIILEKLLYIIDNLSKIYKPL